MNIHEVVRWEANEQEVFKSIKRYIMGDGLTQEQWKMTLGLTESEYFAKGPLEEVFIHWLNIRNIKERNYNEQFANSEDDFQIIEDMNQCLRDLDLALGIMHSALMFMTENKEGLVPFAKGTNAFGQAGEEEFEDEIFIQTNFMRRLEALSFVLTGKKLIGSYQEIARERFYGGALFYLGDGGYSRVFFKEVDEKLYLAFESTDGAKSKWDTPEALELRFQIEGVMCAWIEKTGEETRKSEGHAL